VNNVTTDNPVLAPGGFNRLALPLQHALWARGWTGLRDSQVAALPIILDTQNDVVIFAATASGKTEAAFLPLLTRLWQSREPSSGLVLYVAPVKALINDQVERLQLFGEPMDIPIYPWHGDVGQSSRKRFFADPRGVVMITPESLEALLFRRAADVRRVFANLQAVVVDELHAFIGNVRGRQLQSLLHRLEAQLGQRVQRIGLSASLGDMGLAAEFLRPGHGAEVHVVATPGERRNMQLAVKAIVRPNTMTETAQDAHWTIADELFDRLRGANYLVFPAGVGLVEFYADALRKRCEGAGLPVTFFPHHGRLAKSEREETEVELKRGNLPVSAICTTTLEMGIDIGAIKGVVQIGAPQTVASLCQRIGRAARREGDAAVLWQYCIADTGSVGVTCVSSLYADLVQAVAVIQLFLAKWYEPPQVGALDYSTLIQQILSLVGERHGTTAVQAYQILCQTGPFRGISEADFIAVLRAMAAKDLLMQGANKLLLHGTRGEKMVSHYAFYAAFPDSQEYRLRHGGKELGTLPLPASCAPGDVITFTGRRWRIDSIQHEKRLVELVTSSMGELPRIFGAGLPVHRRVREATRTVLAGSDMPAWLDATARSLLDDARRQYQALQLDRNWLVAEGHKVYLFLWEGDRLQEALVVLLQHLGLKAGNVGICIEILKTSEELVEKALLEIARQPCPAVDALLQREDAKDFEKWDWVLPDDLFVTSYASRALALEEAHALCQRLML
jgi:ATP-dependent helicase Lhr and Lhr-like helicase